MEIYMNIPSFLNRMYRHRTLYKNIDIVQFEFYQQKDIDDIFGVPV